MKTLLFICLISISLSQWGIKNQITERYENGKPKVVLKLKGSGLNEIMLRKETFYKNGDLKSKTNYNSKGEKDGKELFYLNNVRGIKKWPSNDEDIYFLYKEKNYQNGLLHGLTTTYRESSGWLYEKKTYKKGKLNGIFTAYCNTNPKRNCGEVVNLTGYYENNLKNGIWRYYGCEVDKDKNGDCILSGNYLYKIEVYEMGRLTETIYESGKPVVDKYQ